MVGLMMMVMIWCTAGVMMMRICDRCDAKDESEEDERKKKRKRIQKKRKRKPSSL